MYEDLVLKVINIGRYLQIKIPNRNFFSSRFFKPKKMAAVGFEGKNDQSYQNTPRGVYRWWTLGLHVDANLASAHGKIKFFLTLHAPKENKFEFPYQRQR